MRPTAFFGVPRVWEKIQAGIQALLAAEQDPARRAAVGQAMDVGRRYVESCQFGHTTTGELAAAFQQADQAVLAPIRALLGLGEAAIVSSAAAPLPPDVAAFFAGLGLQDPGHLRDDRDHRGVRVQHRGRVQDGHGGPPLPGIEVRIDDDGEI